MDPGAPYGDMRKDEDRADGQSYVHVDLEPFRLGFETKFED